jgi:serine/threonine protein kinase/tetratricopeptide (TPR) repeat protein
MTPERWQQVKEILQSVLDQPSDEQNDFLRDVARGDEPLRLEVESLLEFQGVDENFIETSALEITARCVGAAEDVAAGEQIGPFRVEREIGRGGMGAVYLAQQNDNHYQRQVAIKVIKRGMDSDEIVRRFRNERQILANLTHPNIAGLYSGGTTDGGLPFFVMEYVDGQPINEYCEAHSLTTEQRLRLFRIVCDAISYAHQNLVIHRDLKPSNILVTAAGVPKLLDFGIAKLLKADDASEAAATETLLHVMTPEYASPEQARGERITTGSDVYALGVVLYELLTGRRPYDLKNRLPHEIALIISEQLPERPSSRIEAIAPDSAAPESATKPESINERRGGQLEKLRRGLRGDIDNIVLMALRKDPARRYQSVEQFSEDIRRHLEGLPVRARKDTLGYRASKFVRRNKLGLAAAAVIVLVLLGGILATRRQANRAEHRFNEVRALANSFLFEFDDAIKDLQGATSARELVVRRSLQYLDSLSQEAANDPTLQLELATAYERIASIQGNSYYSNLGDTEGSLRSYRISVGLLERLTRTEPNKRSVQRELAASYAGLGDVLFQKNELAATLGYYEQALSIRRRLIAEDLMNVELRRELSILYSHLGDLKGIPGGSNLGDTRGALEAHRESLRLRQELAASDPNKHDWQFDLASSLSSVGFLTQATGDTNGATQLLRQSIAVLEGLNASEPDNARYRMELNTEYMRFGSVLYEDGQYVEAADLTRRTIKNLEIFIAGESNNSLTLYNLAVAYGFLGRNLTRMGDVSAALKAHASGLVINEKLMEADPTSTDMKRSVWLTHQRTAEAHFAGRDFPSALERYQRAVAMEETLLAGSPDNAQAHDDHSIGLAGLGLTLAALGDVVGARDCLLRAEIEAENLAAQSPSNARLQNRLALRLFEYGRVSEQLAQQSPRGQRETNWRAAHDLLARSLEIWRSLRDQSKLSRVDAGKLDEVTREIARCDIALART